MSDTHPVEDTVSSASDIPATDSAPAEVQVQPAVQVNPVADITELFTKLGHPSPSQWEAKLRLREPDVFRTEDVKYQRFLINRFWQVQLALVDDSLDARFCLIDSESYEHWIGLFGAKVAPWIIANSPNV